MTPNQYVKVLYAARRIVIPGMINELQTELLQYYVRSVDRAYDLLMSGDITEKNYIRWVREFQSAVEQFSGTAEKLSKAEVMRTIQRVGELHSRALERLLTDRGVQVGYSFDGFVDEALRGHIYRRQLRVGNTYKTLQKRNLIHLADSVERDIAQGLNEGRSWKQLRSDLAKTMLFEQNTPEELLKKDIIYLRDIGSDATGGKTAMKKMLFDVDRIARTEINNAYTEADRAGAERSPVIKGIRWTLSGRHEGLPSSPDICDVYAEMDDHGMGAGVYFAETLPARPHPFCLCNILFEMRTPEEWGLPKPEPTQPRRVSENDVRRVLGRDKTDNEVKRVRERYNEYTQLADKVWNAG